CTGCDGTDSDGRGCGTAEKSHAGRRPGGDHWPRTFCCWLWCWRTADGGGLDMTSRRALTIGAAALMVTAVELSATLGSLNGDPMNLAGWAPTREGDGWAILLTIIGSAALFVLLRFPVSAAVVSSGAYVLFIFRDYEFGMTLPVMVTIFTL